MGYKTLFKEENDQVRERYSLALERIRQVADEDTVKAPFKDFFKKTAAFIMMIDEVSYKAEQETLSELAIEELQELNRQLYADILPENYGESYANPEYAVKVLGDEIGQLLSFLYTEIRGMIVYAYECRRVDMTICMELFIEVYNAFEDDELPEVKSIRQILYWFVSDYCDVTLAYRIREQLDPELNFIHDIVMNADLSDEAYLYRYGEYITDNERAVANYLNNEKTQEEIDAMAATMVDGYIRGFAIMGLDISKKKTVNIRFNIGFERMVRAAIKQFEAQGLKAVMYRYGVNAVNRKKTRIGVMATSANKQYDYDHRQDEALLLDKALVERKLSVMKVAYEEYKDIEGIYGGPACIEVFGEVPFEPVHKEACPVLSEKQQKLSVDYVNQSMMIMNEYVDLSSTSFTIIAYPLPEAEAIKNNYNEIFDEIVKINTLDNDVYKAIQQNIIDVLDKAQYVRIKGCGDNCTDLKICLTELTAPEKQTRFENCTADVNIPLGEVFTSPKLAGTEGVLNVSSVYLNDLLFRNLKVTFKDGIITDYSCENFEDEAKNRQFIENNLLVNHKTLPLGEFAIGTNTTAYVIAQKYDIVHLLPILIVEKMGPHFAVGDTCYSHSEEQAVFNPDGKEIIARENDFSLKRFEHPEEAYFNCHTDITIPYDEIGEITAVGVDGTDIPVILDGRFVLAGCEKLNEPFEI